MAVPSQEEVIVRVEEPGSPGTSRAALQPKQTSVDREQGSTSSLTRTSSLGSRIRSNFSSSSRNRYSRTSSSFDTEDVSPSGVEAGPGDDESVLSPQSSITSATSASSGGSQRGAEKGGSSESKDSSPHETDSKAEATAKVETLKKKDKEKRGFFSPRHRAMFPFSSIFTTSHRQKNVEIHKIFTSLAENEKLIDDYSCALQRDILIHGRLYVTQNWLCFYANIFSWETLLTIPFQSVQAITKEKTALVIPNAIQIATTAERYGFSSLISRDTTYTVIFKVWQNSLLHQPLSPLELVRAARKAWGESSYSGTEEELWGPSAAQKDEEEPPSAKKQMSMPTHLELGLLPSSTKPSAIDSPFLTVPEEQPLPSRSPKVAGYEDERMNHSDDTLTGASSDATTGTVSLPPKLDVTRVRRQAAHLEENGAVPSAHAREAAGPKGASLENGSDSGHVSSSRDRRLTGEHPSPDIMSLGGESIASSEYETVSFTEETGEVPCGCSEHSGRTIINEVYSADVESIFQLLFVDSDFMRNFLRARNTINIEIGDWQPQSDGTKLRDLSYTLALNYSFGPKFSPSTEHQIYSKMGQPGLKHIVDTEVVNGNIPYGDAFFASCRYCLTRVAHDKTRVKITVAINFKKSCWGMVKNLIERNAGDGMRSYYNHLDTFLKEYLATLPVRRRRSVHRRAKRQTARPKHRRPSSVAKPPSPSPVPEARESTPPMSAIAKRRLTSVTTLRSFQMDLDEEAPGSPAPASQTSETTSYSVPRINLALTLLLALLVFSNMALYYHLRSYQSPASPPTVPPPPSARVSHLPIDWPSSREEWIALVRQQLEGHDKEIQRWQNTLYSLVQSLEQVEHTIGSTKRLLLAQLEGHGREHQSRTTTGSGQDEDSGDFSLPSTCTTPSCKGPVDDSSR